MIQTSNPINYIEDKTFCDGTNTNIIAQNYCLIPMNVFEDPPYTLKLGDLIISTVKANNQIGWSIESTPNISGQSLMTEPKAVPADLIVHFENTNENQIALEMTAMLPAIDTGGSAIISYSLEWDGATSLASFSALVGELNNNIQLLYTKEGLTRGVVYSFRYRVQNIFGWSPYSAVLS